jgi:hypothetical protein
MHQDEQLARLITVEGIRTTGGLVEAAQAAVAEHDLTSDDEMIKPTKSPVLTPGVGGIDQNATICIHIRGAGSNPVGWNSRYVIGFL